VAQTLVLAGEIYLGLGLLFAILFVWRGAAALDPAARDGTLGFRLVILPGAALLWPWLLWRWWRRPPQPAERGA
jgi:hypothetical protein